MYRKHAMSWVVAGFSMATFIIAPFEVAAEGLQISGVRLDATAYPEISVEFGLRTADGEFVDTLEGGDVSVSENGKTLSGSLSSWSVDEGVAYVFVVDVSGSMRSTLPDIRAGLSAFIGDLSAKDRVAVLSVSDDVRAEADFTADFAGAAAQAGGLEVRGETTQLYYGVMRGTEMLRSQPGLPARHVLVVVSDGRNEGTAYSVDNCLDVARQVNVSIVGLASMPRTSNPDALSLRRLANGSDGLYLEIPTGERWSAKLSVVKRFIAARWRYSWRVSFPGDGASHVATLSVSSASAVARADIPIQTQRASGGGVAGWRNLSMIGGGILLVAGAVTFVTLRARRGARRSRELLERKIEEETKRQDLTRIDLERKIQEVERVARQSGEADRAHSGSDATPTAPSTPAKNKTQFFRPGQEGTRYRTAKLAIVGGVSAGQVFGVTGPRVAIGREGDNDINIPDPKISVGHALVTCANGIFYVEDCGSRNGTYVGAGTCVTSRRALTSGDEIIVGDSVVRFLGEP
jgi:Mg-chelatase subunit ChlD